MQLVPFGSDNSSKCFQGQNETQGSEELLRWLWESGTLELALHRCWSCLWFVGIVLSGLSWLCSKATARCRRARASQSCPNCPVDCPACKPVPPRRRGWDELPGQVWESPPGSREQRRHEPPVSNNPEPELPGFRGHLPRTPRPEGGRRGLHPSSDRRSAGGRGRSRSVGGGTPEPEDHPRSASVTPPEQRRPPEAPAFLLGSVRAHAATRAPAPSYVSRSLPFGCRSGTTGGRALAEGLPRALRARGMEHVRGRAAASAASDPADHTRRAAAKASAQLQSKRRRHRGVSRGGSGRGRDPDERKEHRGDRAGSPGPRVPADVRGRGLGGRGASPDSPAGADESTGRISRGGPRAGHGAPQRPRQPVAPGLDSLRMLSQLHRANRATGASVSGGGLARSDWCEPAPQLGPTGAFHLRGADIREAFNQIPMERPYGAFFLGSPRTND